MMFIQPNEHVIVMEDYLDDFPGFSKDDIKMLEDAGMTLVWLNNSVRWDKLYRKDNAKIAWQFLDERVEKFLNTNLKVILPFFYIMPQWFPDSWYLKKDNVPSRTIPNYANEDLGYAIDNFALEILAHYAEHCPKIQLTFSIPSGGEFLFDPFITKNFPLTDDVLFKFIIDRQKVLVRQHGEIWLHLHNFLGDPKGWNRTHLPALYQNLKSSFPDNPLYSIQFAHFATGNHINFIEGQMLIKEYTEKYGVQFFVGSQYCEGLDKNFNAAIEQKARGFFTAPIHAEEPHKHRSILPWMANSLRLTNQNWNNLYGSNSFQS